MNLTENGKSTSLSRSLENSAHLGHRERLRRRARLEGAEALRPHELLELLLFYAVPRRDVNDLAHALDARFGGVRGVLGATEKELAAFPGVGQRVARWLMRVRDLCEAYGDLRAEDRPMLGNLRCFRNFARLYQPYAERETMWQFCLSHEGRLLMARPIAPCAAWAEPEYLRVAIGDVISSHAHSVLLAQFCDAARPAPDEYDMEHTAAYAETLRRLEVPLLDHLLVGSAADHSMRARGELLVDICGREVANVSERYITPQTSLHSQQEAEAWLFLDDEAP